MFDEQTTWKKEIQKEMDKRGESFNDVVSCTLSEEELNEKFFVGYGSSTGKPFTLWTKKRVYFPVTYNGLEWVASVSRDPDGVPTDHVGGE